MLHRLCRYAVAVCAGRTQLLDDPKLLDVPGNGRLRGLEACLAQLGKELLLCLDVMVMDQLQNLFLAFRFHFNTSVCQ